MSGIKKGLAAIMQYTEEQDRKREESQRPKVTWLTLKDGQSAKIRPLQELDEDSPNYSDKNGLGFLAIEHVNPADYRRKALCTADDGRCFGCERYRADYKSGWKKKSRLYINVLVNDGIEEEPYVAVMSQGYSDKSVTPILMEFASDPEIGSISNRWWKITRRGEKKDTSYTIMNYDVDTNFNVEEYELFDLNDVVRHVPYEDQEQHYMGGALNQATVVETSPAVDLDLSW